MSKAWMPLYVGDYLGDTTHLNQGQHGAYLLFIMHYWQRGSLPSSKEECYCIARAMDELSKSNADRVLMQFFCLEGVAYKHSRIDAELVKAKESYEKRVSAANARWDRAKHPSSTSNGTALHEQSDSQSHIKPIVLNRESELPEDVDRIVLNIGRLHPANAHRKESLVELPHDQAVEILTAIQNHGEEAVIAGTRNYAEVVATWPMEGRARRIKGAARFYREGDYLRDPREWREEILTGGNGHGQQTSRTAARAQRTASNIFDGITADARRRTTPDVAQREVGTTKRIG